MIILDTNVLSALMRHSADKKVVDWLDKQPRTSIWTTSITILEVRFGLQILPVRKRRTALVQAFEKVLVDKIESRVAPFDTAAAQEAGDLMSLRHNYVTILSRILPAGAVGISVLLGSTAPVGRPSCTGAAARLVAEIRDCARRLPGRRPPARRFSPKPHRESGLRRPRRSSLRKRS